MATATIDTSRDHLVKDNIRLVYREAHRYKRQGVLSFDELVSEGMLALLRCARSPKYDPAIAKFSSYAVPSIRRQMYGAIKHREKHRISQEPESDRDTDHAPALDAMPAPDRSIRRDTSRTVRTVLNCLSDPERNIIHLLYAEGLSPVIAARITGKSVSEVNQLASNAVYRMRLRGIADHG